MAARAKNRKTSIVHQSGTGLTILVEGHLSNIPMKFE